MTAPRHRVRELARSTGRLVEPDSSQSPAGRDEVIAPTRGTGNAVSAALAEERAQR